MASSDPPASGTTFLAPRPRVLLGDDHEILLDMLRNLLEPEFAVAGLASNGWQLVAKAEELRPDIVIADIRMPGCNGMEAGRQIRALESAVRLVFLTVEEDEALAAEAFALGAAAYLLKAASAADFLEAIRVVAAGGRYLARSIAGGDIDQLLRMRQGQPLAQISAREREVLGLLVSGLPMKTVARKLGITARTVAFHKYKAMETLGLKDNAQLMDFALRHKLLVTDEPGRHPN